jgi:cell wall-associated NlpC family hydrolase
MAAPFPTTARPDCAVQGGDAPMVSAPPVGGRIVSLALAAGVLATTSVGLGQSAPAHAADLVAAHPAAVAAAVHPTAVRSRPLRHHIWRFAIHQRGKPYVWGGTGPRGFDCSGLVYSAYRSRGVHLPRTTTGMLGSWHLVRIKKYLAREGDLAFFGSGHVELYYKGKWTYGAAHSGTRIGFHRMSRYWHPTMYFRVRRH